MQQRRYRPGDVLDDYCPRERRITDHAIVAMIDDHIKQTRCVSCDAEHEYKEGKAPPQRRKKPQAALFAQVLDGINGPQLPARPTVTQAQDADELSAEEATIADPEPISAPPVVTAPVPDPPAPFHSNDDLPAPLSPTNGNVPPREEGPWRRQLIRAALPRPEGQPPPASRPVPEFTVRQPNSARPHRHDRRRSGGFGSANGNGNHGGARFGRGGQGHGQGGRRRRGRGGKKNG